jgi:hypothetical protein
MATRASLDTLLIGRVHADHIRAGLERALLHTQQARQTPLSRLFHVVCCDQTPPTPETAQELLSKSQHLNITTDLFGSGPATGLVAEFFLYDVDPTPFADVLCSLTPPAAAQLAEDLDSFRPFPPSCERLLSAAYAVAQSCSTPGTISKPPSEVAAAADDAVAAAVAAGPRTASQLAQLAYSLLSSQLPDFDPAAQLFWTYVYDQTRRASACAALDAARDRASKSAAYTRALLASKGLDVPLSSSSQAAPVPHLAAGAASSPQLTPPLHLPHLIPDPHPKSHALLAEAERFVQSGYEPYEKPPPKSISCIRMPDWALHSRADADAPADVREPIPNPIRPAYLSRAVLRVIWTDYARRHFSAEAPPPPVPVSHIVVLSLPALPPSAPVPAVRCTPCADDSSLAILTITPGAPYADFALLIRGADWDRKSRSGFVHELRGGVFTLSFTYKGAVI